MSRVISWLILWIKFLQCCMEKSMHYHFYNNFIIFLFCREKFQGATWLDWQALDMWLLFFFVLKLKLTFFFSPRGMFLLLEDILSNGRFKWLETAKCTISTYHHLCLAYWSLPSPWAINPNLFSSFSHPATVAVICNSLPNAILPYSSAYLSSVIWYLLFYLYSENRFKKSGDWHFSRSQKHIIFQS